MKQRTRANNPINKEIIEHLRKLNSAASVAPYMQFSETRRLTPHVAPAPLANNRCPFKSIYGSTQQPYNVTRASVACEIKPSTNCMHRHHDCLATVAIENRLHTVHSVTSYSDVGQY